MEAMVCTECDHIERDPIGLDTETCLVCGGRLEADDDYINEAEFMDLDDVDMCAYHAD